MSSIVTISTSAFWGMITAWFLVPILVIILVALWRFTPAMVFLKGRFRGKPILHIKYRTGMSEFVCGENLDPGTIDVKKGGTTQSFIMSEGSQTFEKKSRSAIFNAFSEYGATIPHEYEAIIQELKEAGFSVTGWDDYYNLYHLASSETYRQKCRAENKGQALIELDEIIKKLALMKNGIEIKPYKTYGFKELANFYPNNISPVYIDAKVENAKRREIAKLGLNQKMWMYVGFGALLICLGIVVIYRLIKTGECPPPQVIVKTIETGTQYVMSNSTIVA